MLLDGPHLLLYSTYMEPIVLSLKAAFPPFPCCNPDCDNKSKKTCGGCGSLHKASYCSVECQKSQWPVHKAFCKDPEVVKLWTEYRQLLKGLEAKLTDGMGSMAYLLQYQQIADRFGQLQEEFKGKEDNLDFDFIVYSIERFACIHAAAYNSNTHLFQLFPSLASLMTKNMRNKRMTEFCQYVLRIADMTCRDALKREKSEAVHNLLMSRHLYTYEHLAKLLRKAYDNPTDVKLAHFLFITGEACLHAREFEKSKSYLSEAHDIYMKEKGDNSNEIACCFLAHAILISNADEEQHTEVVQRAVAIKEQLFGPESKEVAMTYEYVAYLYNFRNREEEAEEWSRKAQQLELQVTQRKGSWELQETSRLAPVPYPLDLRLTRCACGKPSCHEDE